MSGPEKPKVIGEEWSDERVRSFLDLEPYDTSLDRDFFVLQRAYQSMRAGDFERFLGFFTEAGRNLNGTDDQGRTILDLVSEHGRSGEYVKALKAAGAQPA